MKKIVKCIDVHKFALESNNWISEVLVLNLVKSGFKLTVFKYYQNVKRPCEILLFTSTHLNYIRKYSMKSSVTLNGKIL